MFLAGMTPAIMAEDELYETDVYMENVMKIKTR